MYSTSCNVYHYHDFRQYLKDVIDDLKNQAVGFSYRNFSKAAGLGSPNFLLLLAKGERNLSQKTALKIAKTFGLDQMQCAFFENLVQYNQAKQADEKITYATEIFKIRSQLDSYKLECAEFSYYQKWYNIVVKEIIQLEPGISFERIEAKLQPKVSNLELIRSLQTLMDLNFIEKVDGVYFSRVENIKTGDKFTSASVIQFHKNMMKLADESLDRFKTEERDITCVTTGLSKENFQKIRAKIKDLRQEILALSQADQNKKDVIQINFQMFPLTKEDSSL